MKDYEFSMNVNAKERAETFQSYIDQMSQFETKRYWITATSGVGAKMRIEGNEENFSAYISNELSGNVAATRDY